MLFYNQIELKSMKFRHSLRKELKAMMILLLKSIFLYCNDSPLFEEPFILTTKNNNFIVTIMERFLVN